jgi:hypothetical protein
MRPAPALVPALALACLGLLSACPGPPGMPKVPPPEYEDEPSPGAGAGAGVGAGTSADGGAGGNGSAGANAPCARDEDCMAGLKCTCLGVGARIECAQGNDCPRPCGQQLCVDPKNPPPPPPSPPR